MSFCEIEDLKIFMGFLDAEVEKDTTPVFVKSNKILDQKTATVTGYILIQLQYDGENFLQHNYTDNIDPVVEIPLEFFQVMKHYFSEEEIKNIQEKLKAARNKMDQQLKDEEDKLCKILADKGFKIVIPGIWE